MAIPSQPIITRDGTITLQDASGIPIVATAIYEAGDLSIEGLEEGGKMTQEFRDRGEVSGLRTTDDKILDVSFSFDLTELTHATDTNIPDALRKKGAFAAGVSTWGTAVSDPWTLQLRLAVERTDAGGAADRTVTFPYFRGEMTWAEGNPMRCSVKGKAFPKGSTEAVTIA